MSQQHQDIAENQHVNDAIHAHSVLYSDIFKEIRSLKESMKGLEKRFDGMDKKLDKVIITQDYQEQVREHQRFFEFIHDNFHHHDNDNDNNNNKET